MNLVELKLKLMQNVLYTSISHTCHEVEILVERKKKNGNQNAFKWPDCILANFTKSHYFKV